MDIFLCRATDFNYTLIPYSDMEIVKATRHFFPNTTHDHFFEEDMSKNVAYMTRMHEAIKAGKGTLSFITNGKIPLEKSPVKIEQRRLSYYSDAPYGFLSFIQQMPAGSYPTYSDRSFKAFYDDMNLDLNPIFMPHGGPIKLRPGKHMEDREYPLSFIGHVRLPEPLGRFETLLEGSDPRLIQIVAHASERVFAGETTAYVAVKQEATKAGLHPMTMLDLATLKALLSKMEGWAEMQNRLSLLRAFKDFPIHFFGPIRSDVSGVTDNENFVFHGKKMGAEVLEIIRNTRILINSVTVFPEGAHERIWFALANGCLPYTDHGSYIEESFTDEENILFINYRDLEKEAERLCEYANDPNRLQSMIDKAMPIYASKHTWIHRLDATFRQIPELEPFMPQEELNKEVPYSLPNSDRQ
ncbi:glycosyltransferase [Curvivirga aplysinae]|uniref:glycosyltransferase n=1 Tax=Curvivirga aplysinae TaxID=2529852 RepID=UPI0012BD7D0C|nr:glycosyltransferase [Curvivirga aplysinae]MTI09995.1 glycosyltransferase family 1 protein [Curvivirga aplysinae]